MLSYVDQLTMLCIFNSFNMKNNVYIVSMDLLHFEKKKIRFWKSKYGFEFLMLF